MSDPKVPLTLPPTGSFPFYDEAVRLGKTWTQLWFDQGSIWNEQWSKLKENKYELKDWFSALARSTELTAAAVGDVFIQLTGDPTPPWASLSHDTSDYVPIRLRVSLNLNETVRVSDLSLLGNRQPGGPLPKVEVTRVKDEARLVKVTMAKPLADFPAGQYIGFIMRSSSPEPIAIVTVNKVDASAIEDAEVAAAPKGDAGTTEGYAAAASSGGAVAKVAGVAAKTRKSTTTAGSKKRKKKRTS